MTASPEQRERKEEEHVDDQDHVRSLLGIQHRTGRPKGDDEALQATFRSKVPVLVVPEPNETFQPSIEALRQSLELDRAIDVEKWRRGRLGTVDVLEDLSIGLTQHIEAKAAGLFSDSVRDLALQNRIGTVGPEEIANAGQPEQPRGR